MSDTLFHGLVLLLQDHKEQVEQITGTKETTLSMAEEILQAELNQCKEEIEEAKAEEEMLKNNIAETKLELDQERQVHEETKRQMQKLEVSAKPRICI